MDCCAVAWLPRHEAIKRVLGICCAIIFIYGPCIPPLLVLVMSCQYSTGQGVIVWLWRAVFAVAVTAFLVLSIVRTIVVKAKIVGLELHPLPLPVAVLGSRRVRQSRCFAPLTSESLFVSLSLPMSPNHHTVLVRCCRPPCPCSSDIDNDPPGRCWKTRMKTHRCQLNNAAPSSCCTNRAAL